MLITMGIIGVGAVLLAWFFWEEINNWIDNVIERYKPTIADLYATVKRGTREVIFTIYYWVTGSSQPMSVSTPANWDDVPEDFISRIPDGERVKIGTSKK